MAAAGPADAKPDDLDPALKAAITAGDQHYRAGAYSEAAAIFARAAEAAPGAMTPLRMLGLCRLRQGDAAAALDLLTRARALAPGDPYAELHYGMGLQAVGRHREAADQFARCCVLLPEEAASFLNLAAALLALGDNRGALDAARRARRRAPRLPEAHYTLGLALLSVDRLVDAADAFAVCLKHAPNFADAWVNIGVIRYRNNDINGAKAAMRRALAIAPAHRVAAANLSVFQRLTGESEDAEALLAGLLARDPDAAEARVNLAAMLLHEERAVEALTLLDARPPLTEPRIRSHWELQRSLALLQQGRLPEARAALRELGDDVPAELRSLLLWRRAYLANIEGDFAAARRFAEEMGRVLREEPALIPEHRIMGNFDLARFWSQHADADRAFPHWVEGHRLLGLMQPFSRDVSRAYFDANIAQFDRARLHDGPRAANRDPAPVFIVGMPRSGTTLAEQILGAHPAAFGAGERSALVQMFYALGGGETPEGVARVAGLDAAALDAAAERYLAELHALAPQATRIVDKMPGNFAFLGLTALMLPGARILYCARDPRDIGLSIFTFRFYGYHPYAHNLADLGWYIGQHTRLMAHWQAALPNPIMTVQLKDWVDDFTGTLRRVLDFVDLPYDSACERFYEQDTRVRTVSRAQVRQPVNARGLGRWRPYERHLQPLLETLAAGGALPAG